MGSKFLLLTLVASAALPAQDQVKQQKVLFDTWAIMKMAGAEVGYVRTTTTRLGTGPERRFQTVVDTKMQIKRLGSTLKIEQGSLTIESADGALIRIDSRMKMSNQETASQVFFEPEAIRIVTALMGRKRETKLEAEKDLVGPYRMQLLIPQHGFAKGTKWEAKTFIGDLQAVSTVRYHVHGQEEVELEPGQKRVLTKIVVTMDKVPMPVTTWVDVSGIPIKVATKAGGISITTLIASKEKALAAVGAGKLSPDLFKETMIVAKEFLPYSRRSTAAKLKVRVKDPSLKLEVPSSQRQTVGAIDSEGLFTVQLKSVIPMSEKAGTRPLENVPAELESSLRANTMIQSDEAEIIAIAKRVVGDQTDAWKAAQALEKWVNINITNKGYGIGFASALEVCRDRSGDCSEHAVLMAALCRAAGIPARVAMGVIYVGGIWGGHAWNEVWIDGHWYALDATIGLGSVDALHLTLVSMSMQDGTSGVESANLARALGNLEIQVESLVCAGKTIPVAGMVTVRDGLYLNRHWGFSCRAPRGFRCKPQKPRANIGYKLLEIDGRNSAGKNCEIRVSVFGTQPGLDYAVLVKSFRRGGKAASDLHVDGRKGCLIESKRPEGRRKLVAVINGEDAVFVFEWNRVSDSKDVATFHAFLQGVKLGLDR